MSRLALSFSGGETSAYMLLWAKKNLFPQYDEWVVTFANTGQENEQTLEFVDRVQRFADVPVVWVEAVVHHGSRKGSTHKVVDFETASRNGEPFEEVIKKYGIPNHTFQPCTRELKTNPMESYRRGLGWKLGTYQTAIGIRADEPQRIRPDAASKNLIYPLAHMHRVSKKHINAFWESMPFRLELTGYQGNCKWCWKKTLRKHLTIITETPEAYEFPERMEKMYAFNGARADGDTEPRRFFRRNRTVQDLRELAARGDFEMFHDDARIYPEPDLFDLDEGETDGCVESCEAY